MSSVVKAKCPQCKTEVAVEEEESSQPVSCSSCQTTFVPAAVIAESNRRFEIGMYVVMLLIGIGLVGYMAMTGNLKPKPDAPPPPQAAEMDTVPE
ncbi:hypothetical protein FYK55_25025 [Roseiconus nitratireducens]|uniref:Uncharacterized protein n=1 Tax=Roseiconus nitratireducens TaxID=2605748 RepID=A0A5M6CW65_9BACT|nr:hypothetical protein [Roseiconus nitratireducens]KAA5539186.1 hypothetical protein FYK55_25025 [Roseiconus nitratireducens]